MATVTMTPELDARLKMLNPEQQLAVSTLDGPVLVVAGPGTGKTELLSLRVAKILLERDVLPQNILCLTFTDAGARAMQQRLADLIGAAAYDVEISTFHAFASRLATNYPEYFLRRASDTAISTLQASKLVNSLLMGLKVDDPLFQRPFNGVVGTLNNVISFISYFKRSGLRIDELQGIIQQNEEAFDYLEKSTDLLSMVGSRVPGSAAKKEAFFASLLDLVNRLEALAPERLRSKIIGTPGVYEPYLSYFARMFNQGPLYDSDANKSDGYALLRKLLFAKDNDGNTVIKARQSNLKMTSALEVFRQYQESLDKAGQFDFDDMIFTAIEAVAGHPAFKHNLHDQYKYLLVDEFQDTNGAQMRILDLLSDYSVSPNILVVGDDDQAIMRFQGASVMHLLQFEQKFANIARIVLKTNYRSVPSLVGLGQELAVQIVNRLPASAHEKQLQSFLSDAPDQGFTAREYASREAQYLELARAIKDRIDSGFVKNASRPTEAIAVIAYRHDSLRALIPYLNALEVPFNYRLTSSVDEIASLQTFFHCLRFVNDLASRSDALAESHLPAILASKELGLSPDQYIEFALNCRSNRQTWLTALRLSEDSSLQGIYTWLARLAVSAKSSPVRQLLHELITPLREYYEKQDDIIQLVEFNKGISALLAFVEAELLNARALGLTTGSDSGQVASSHPLSLSDLVSTFDDASRFNEKINVDIEMSRPDSIDLTTAHGSKGLQYDLVYLIDADDRQWHSSGRAGTQLVADNMLFGQERDDDDSRRLLFVAVTRAKRLLEVTLGNEGLARELLGLVNVEKTEASAQSLLAQSEISLAERFYPYNSDWPLFVSPHLQDMQMSASLLNAFIQDSLGGLGAEGFFASSVLRLPEKPSVAVEFGNLMHRFFEDWLNHVVRSQDIGPKDLVQAYLEEVSWLDFEELEREQLRQRLRLVVEQFIPQAGGIFVAHAIAEKWAFTHLDDVPLTGKFDLIVPDQASKTLRVFDFKTGRNTGQQKIDAAQWRQLMFYKLLLELSPEYRGWTVTAAVDLFVDPTNVSGGNVSIPSPIDMSGLDLGVFKLLVKAVWQRLQSGDLDVSGFAESPQLAGLRAGSVYKSDSKGGKKGDPKEPSSAEVEAVFEQWLIDGLLG
ncbi:MAG: ATP-dependent helicase [Coriobacteriia bacterium]|nr:ATP-dependent helicase [Coriobacteriia bacterium]